MYWLNVKTDNWIILNENNTVLCICDSKNYSTVRTLSASLKKHLFKENIEKSKDKELCIINKIGDDNEFCKYLVKYFIKNDNDTNNKNDTNNDTNNNINNINIDMSSLKMNGYNKKKLLVLIQYYNKKKEECIICSFCDKKLSSEYCKKIHEDKYCKSKNQYGIELENQFLKKENVNLKTENSILKDQLKSCHPIININQTNNITQNNIQNNINVLSKKDKLNIYYNKTVDIDTFIDKYKNDPKYQLTAQEAEVLLDILDFNGYIGYSNGLSTYLKSKCSLIFNDIHNDTGIEEQSILPFVNNDAKHRTHYEKNESSWVVVKNDEKIKTILSISSGQLYIHHNKNVILNSRETKMVINNLLGKSDLNHLHFSEPAIEEAK
jgi:hypothetical protein